MKKIGIYKLTSPSGKCYIGQSKNLKRRMDNYERLNCKGQKKLYKALIKYGFDNFIVEILFDTDKNFKHVEIMLDSLEIHFIKQFNSVNNGYNITKGGGGIRGFKQSEESKKRMSISHIGKSHSDKTKNKMGESHKGKIISVETKQKISDATKGKIVSDETKKRMSDAQKKPVIQLSKTGEFIAEFCSSIEASKSIGSKSSKGISNVLVGRTKLSGVYIWKYKEEFYKELV